MLSFLVLIIQLWLFAGTLFTLHHLSARIGLTPVLFFISGVVAILNFAELLALYIEPFPGIIIRTGAHVFVPILLISILLLYIANGTSIAQLVLYGLTGVNIMVVVVLIFLIIYMVLSDTITPMSGLLVNTNIINLQFLRGVISSTLIFFVNTFMMVILYQGIRNTFPKTSLWISIPTALVTGLWIDSILYNLLANLGTANFQLWLPGDVVAKTLSGIVVAPMASYYLIVVAPKSATFRGKEKRATFDMLFGTFTGVKRSLRDLQQELGESRETVTILRNLVRDASHDLKSPITALQLKIELIERVRDEGLKARYLAELKQQSSRLSLLIDDLFTLTRLEGNRLLTKTSLDLVEIAKKVYDNFILSAEQKNLKFILDLPQESIPFIGLEDELERIMMNLVGNAIRYTHDGDITFSIYEDARYVIIKVNDTGIGITEADLPNIFNQFYRASNARDRAIQGTGLGLAIVKTIVELHDGTVHAESTLDVGTTITITLPKTAEGAK
jgi:signal transduction histidine kinase